MTEAPITLTALVALLHAARYGRREIARDALLVAWPTAAERDEGIAHLRALDPDAADVIARLAAEVSQ